MAYSWMDGLVMTDSCYRPPDHPDLKGKNRPEGMGTKPGVGGGASDIPLPKIWRFDISGIFPNRRDSAEVPVNAKTQDSKGRSFLRLFEGKRDTFFPYI